MQSNMLKSKIALVGINQERLAEMMGANGASIDRATLNQKINAKREFNQSEIKALIDALKLSNEEAIEIFFTSNVS